MLRPGGRLYLQVPVGQPGTTTPSTPEFHGDDTPVFWRFGVDLTERLRSHCFATRLLVTADLHRRVLTRDAGWPDQVYSEFDIAGIVGTLDPADLAVAATDEVAVACGFYPSYMFLTWEAVKPR